MAVINQEHLENAFISLYDPIFEQVTAHEALQLLLPYYQEGLTQEVNGIIEVCDARLLFGPDMSFWGESAGNYELRFSNPEFLYAIPQPNKTQYNIVQKNRDVFELIYYNWEYNFLRQNWKTGPDKLVPRTPDSLIIIRRESDEWSRPDVRNQIFNSFFDNEKKFIAFSYLPVLLKDFNGATDGGEYIIEGEGRYVWYKRDGLMHVEWYPLADFVWLYEYQNKTNKCELSMEYLMSIGIGIKYKKLRERDLKDVENARCYFTISPVRGFVPTKFTVTRY